jgi:uncharacterized protein (DUF2141 family)
MTGRILTVLAVAGLCAVAVTAGQQARDTAPRVAGAATISGMVFVDDEARQPARRVRVTLTDITRTATGQTTTTDDKGAFTFRGLPAGQFELQAFKPGYLRGSYGATRPNRAGTPVVVSEGQTMANLSIPIVRGGVITGTVRDVRGQPLAGRDVRVLRLGYNVVTGERTLGAASTGSTLVTDDRGEYRAYGLPPGGYFVLVPASPGQSGGRGVDPIRPLTSDDVRQAIQRARAGGPGPPQPTSASSAPVRVDYAPVFHPGVTDLGMASTVALGLGEERTGVDVTVQLVPMATITGTVTSPAGALPQFVSVHLMTAGSNTEMLVGAGLRGTSASPGPDGRFTFPAVAPGTYTVKATVGASGGRGVPVTNAPMMWAAADVVVTGSDVDVRLTLQPGVPISGRVVFTGAQPTATQLESLQFQLLPSGSGGRPLFTGGGRVNSKGQFTFAAVPPDAYQFLVNWTDTSARDAWTIVSSSANGDDAFESPLRVTPNADVEWTVTFTDTPTTLIGVFQDGTGRAATDYYLLVFSTDRQFWTAGSRRVRTTRPATDGTFSVKGLPPGEYFLAALTDLEAGEWNDPTLLDELVASSTTVTLREGQTTRQDIRIGGDTPEGLSSSSHLRGRQPSGAYPSRGGH